MFPAVAFIYTHDQRLFGRKPCGKKFQDLINGSLIQAVDTGSEIPKEPTDDSQRQWKPKRDVARPKMLTGLFSARSSASDLFLAKSEQRSLLMPVRRKP